MEVETSCRESKHAIPEERKEEKEDTSNVDRRTEFVYEIFEEQSVL